MRIRASGELFIPWERWRTLTTQAAGQSLAVRSALYSHKYVTIPDLLLIAHWARRLWFNYPEDLSKIRIDLRA